MDSARLNIESGELNLCANHMPAWAAVSGNICEELLIASTASPIVHVFSSLAMIDYRLGGHARCVSAPILGRMSVQFLPMYSIQAWRLLCSRAMDQPAGTSAASGQSEY